MTEQQQQQHRIAKTTDQCRTAKTTDKHRMLNRAQYTAQMPGCRVASIAGERSSK